MKQGQNVKEGDPLLQLQSLEVLERIADLSFKRADLAAKFTDFKIRADSVEQLLPLAESREAEAQRVITQFQGMQKEGFVRSAPYADALKAGYEASKDRVNLGAQSRVLKEELRALELARTDADSTFQDLQKHLCQRPSARARRRRRRRGRALDRRRLPARAIRC